MPIFCSRKFTFFPFLILFKRIESIDMTPCVISFLVYFSFYRPSQPNFLKIEKKIKAIFFSILFLFFPPTYASTGLEFNYVFSFCLFYYSQVD